ncbi:hypothetical protein GGX14DRAFT_401629 [Mycena pura]|uniref:Uncharacterized protein n=1 Tax=Mycena pura TaxID=153505 RepID=A0AAD6V2K0_9AGAR|nr:hypothetical protein GGX14DRAFT_401629 [Mycena pura]
MSSPESSHDSPALYEFVTRHPTQVQVLLQVATHLLGFIHVFTLSTVTNFSTRLRFKQGPISLRQLRLWHSLSSIKVAWNLPILHAGILVGYPFLHLLPASLWAAALAPIPSQSTIVGTLHTPSYPLDPTGEFWNKTSGARSGNRVGNVTRNENGVFSFTPAAILHGPILNSASAAASVGPVQVHAKIDNSRLSYIGRSYGVGASAGLDNIVLEGEGQRTSFLYMYREPGYMTDVNCWRNESSGWGVHFWANRTSPAFPDEYLACGVQPNSLYQPGTVFTDSGCPGLIPGYEADWYAVFSIGQSDAEVFALQGLSRASRHMFGIATGTGEYTVLDRVQCEAFFTPQDFQVSVNMTSSLITVTPLGNSTVDIDPSAPTYGAGFGLIPQFIVDQVTYLSQGITGIYSSAMGDTFISNIQNAALAHNSSVNDTSIVLEGISSSLESMIDDLLLSVASAQLEIAWNDSAVADSANTAFTDVTVAAMRVGTFPYVVIIATLNFLIVAIYLVEFARTRAWRGLPLFDYTDIASVVVAVSRGGQELGASVASAHQNKGIVWKGDSGNMEGADTRMTLRSHHAILVTSAAPLSDVDRAVAVDLKQKHPHAGASDVSGPADTFGTVDPSSTSTFSAPNTEETIKPIVEEVDPKQPF